MAPQASTNKDLKSSTDKKVNTSVEDTLHGSTNTSTESFIDDVILKIPPLTVIYWCEKMTATTFGETFADFFTQTLDFGYTVTSIVLIAFFAVTLALQLKVRSYWPMIFWLVMASSSVAGTCISDFIDRTLQWGYPLGMGVLLSILLVIIGIWKLSGEHMNVAGAMTRLAEGFYWATILTSNTLGTALGDFVADSLGLGFGASAGIFGGLLTICAFLAYFTKVSHVVLFWIAFVLTRPFGATFGDLLTKSKAKGGLDLGTLNASMVILGLFLICFGIEMYNLRKAKLMKLQNDTNTGENSDSAEIKAVVINSGNDIDVEEPIDEQQQHE
jgi:uncharacterized membrane-anchored protein